MGRGSNRIFAPDANDLAALKFPWRLSCLSGTIFLERHKKQGQSELTQGKFGFGFGKSSLSSHTLRKKLRTQSALLCTVLVDATDEFGPSRA